MKIKEIVLATLMAFSASYAQAGNWTQLNKGVNGVLTTGASNGGLQSGANIPTGDKLYLQTVSATYVPGYENDGENFEDGLGNVVAKTINYNTTTGSTVTGSGSLTLLDWRVSKQVDLAPGSKQADIFDFVYKDSSGSLVFATRYLNRENNFEEANYLYRYNFSTTSQYTPQVAWLASTNFDLRMYQAGLTDSTSLNNSANYNENVVRQKGDFSYSEGAPWSGLFLVKTDATAFTVKANSIGFAQAGEEGQTAVRGAIAGFAATNLSEGVASGSTTYAYGGNYAANIAVSGNLDVKSGHATFGGNVVVNNGGAINTEVGATSTFNGSFNQHVGAILAGGGTFEFNGGYSAGNSPGAVTVDGNVIFGNTNQALFEIAGTALGAEYDHLTVNGVLTFGGELNISFLNGFTASAGQTFDLFDFTSATGTFTSINFTNASLGTGLVWNTSNLYANGTISVASVTAVPEPESYALMMLGLGVVAMVRRQKKQA